MNKRHLLNRSAIGQAKVHEVKRKSKHGLVSGIILVSAVALVAFAGTVSADETTAATANDLVAIMDSSTSDNFSEQAISQSTNETESTAIVNEADTTEATTESTDFDKADTATSVTESDENDERNIPYMLSETDFDDEGYEKYRKEISLPKIRR